MDNSYYELKKRLQQCIDEKDSKIAMEDATLALVDIALNCGFSQVERLELFTMYNRVVVNNKVYV